MAQDGIQRPDAYEYTPLPVQLQEPGRTTNPLIEWVYAAGGRYPRFASHKPGIRLLTLHPDADAAAPISCTLTVLRDIMFLPHPFSAFEALSYTWGDVRATEAILCDGKQLAVTRSLAVLLRRCRLPDRPRTLWADGVCINQADPQERSLQVRVMPWIYMLARDVLVWLGDEAPDDNLALPLMAHIQECLSQDTTGEQEQEQEQQIPLPKRMAAALRTATHLTPDPLAAWAAHTTALLARPYFQRMWVLQEVANAAQGHGEPSATVMCGPHSVPWSAFSSAMSHRPDIANELAGGVRHAVWAGLHTDPGMNSVLLMQTMQKTRWDCEKPPPRASESGGGGAEAGGALTLHDMLFATRTLRATDPRDKLFALLGLPLRSGRALPEPDYTVTDPMEVFRRWVVMDVVENRSLLALSWAGLGDEHGNLPTAPRPGGVPSWVPDLGVPGPSPVFTYLACVRGESAAGAASRSTATVSEDGMVITARGWEASRIRVLGSTRRQLSEHKGLPPQPQPQQPRTASAILSDDEELEMGRLRLDAAQIAQCYEICLRRLLGPEADERISSGEKPLWAFMLDDEGMRYFLGRVTYDWDEFAQGAFEPDDETLERLRVVVNFFLGLDDGVQGEEEVEREKPYLAEFVRLFRARVKPRETYRFCALENGGLGWVPARAEVGDTVVVLEGARVPFVLRSRPENDDSASTSYELLGEAWIDGLMNGEVVNGENVQQTTFSLV